MIGGVQVMTCCTVLTGARQTVVNIALAVVTIETNSAVAGVAQLAVIVWRGWCSGNAVLHEVGGFEQNVQIMNHMHLKIICEHFNVKIHGISLQ